MQYGVLSRIESDTEANAYISDDLWDTLLEMEIFLNIIKEIVKIYLI